MLKHSDGKMAMNGLMPGKDGKLPTFSKMEKPAPKAHDEKPAQEPAGEHSELHPHPDGVGFTTKKGGSEEEHPDLGHALMAMAAHHKPEGKHFHAHHDGVSTHTHGSAGGEHEEPMEHGSVDEAMDHGKNYLADDSSDGEEPDSDDGQDHEGLSGFGG